MMHGQRNIKFLRML